MCPIDFHGLYTEKISSDKLSSLIAQSDFFSKPNNLSAKDHSKVIDRVLGYRTNKIEQKLLRKYKAYYKVTDEDDRKKHFQGTQTWIGLNPQVLQTPYSEISRFLSFFKKYSPKKIIDFGAGYGRIGIVMNAIFPNAEFVGHEIMPERLNEANRVFHDLNLTNCKVVQENILDDDFQIPKADIYFIYDFSDPMDLRIILNKLSKKLYRDRFFLVARGEGVRSLIQLKYPEFWAAHGVIHQDKISIFSSYIDLI